MILPIVKEQIKKEGLCNIPSTITCSFDGDAAKLGAKALASFDERITLVNGNAFIAFAEDTALEEKDEIYSVTVNVDSIRVCFRDKRGAVNGAATVALLLRKKELSVQSIVDYPSCGYRGLMIDPGYFIPPMDLVENTIRYMALAKYNRLHLHLVEKNGPCYVSKAVPEYKYTSPGSFEPWTLDDLRDIIAICKKYAIEVIPEIEIPGHARSICNTFPDFKCQVENAQSWTVCAGNEELYDFIDKLVGELAEVFADSEYIHIGSDEIEFLDLPAPEGPLVCHWEECPRCKALREREGLADMREEFYYLMRRCREICMAHGKKMMMWNDQIDVSRDEVDLPRDILMDFWRVAARGRGPHDGCSLEKLLQKGFAAVNSFYKYAYVDEEHYLSSEKLKTWTPYTMPEQSPEVKDNMIGGELCIWYFANMEANGKYYAYTFPPTLAVFGDKLWGLGEREYTDEYKAALSEYIFGNDGFTGIFECVGDIIPPRTRKFFTYQTADKLDKALIEACIEKLRANDKCFVSENYIELLERIAEVADNA